MNYADPFGIQESTPLSRALRRIELTEAQSLNWPNGYLGTDYIASINLVNPASTDLSLTLPDALGASEGTGFLIVNTGQFTFSLHNYAGTVVTSLPAGQAKYVYCSENPDSTGVWNTILFGEGVSLADAVALAGQGITVTDGKLSVGLTVSTTASDVTIGAQHRGKVIVNNGGSISVNLPQYNVVGNNFFVCLHNGGSGTMSVHPSTNNTVDDATNLALAPNESVIVCCSGTSKWYTLGYGRSTQFQFTKLVKDISAGGTITLTSAEASNKLLQFTGAPTNDVTAIVPSVVGIYYVQNTYSGPNSLTLKTQNGAGLSLNAGDRAIVYCDGINIVSAQSVAVGVNLSVVDGSLDTPSIGFSSDPNTGIFKADFDTVGLSSNGVEAARFHKDKSAIHGNLGVKTDNPVVSLHVRSNITETIRVDADEDPLISFYHAGVYRGNVSFQDGKELRMLCDTSDSTIATYIGGAKKTEVSSAGLRVFGTLTDTNNNSYITNGSNTFNGIQVITTQRGKLITPSAPVAGVLSIDTSKGNSFSYTVTGPIRIDFVNKPAAGQEQTIYVKLTNGGSNVSYGSMCQFPDAGLRPTLSSSGKDVLAVWYDPEADVFVVGRAFKDYRT